MQSSLGFQVIRLPVLSADVNCQAVQEGVEFVLELHYGAHGVNFLQVAQAFFKYLVRHLD